MCLNRNIRIFIYAYIVLWASEKLAPINFNAIDIFPHSGKARPDYCSMFAQNLNNLFTDLLLPIKSNKSWTRKKQQKQQQQQLRRIPLKVECISYAISSQVNKNVFSSNSTFNIQAVSYLMAFFATPAPLSIRFAHCEFHVSNIFLLEKYIEIRCVHFYFVHCWRSSIHFNYKTMHFYGHSSLFFFFILPVKEGCAFTLSLDEYISFLFYFYTNFVFFLKSTLQLLLLTYTQRRRYIWQRQPHHPIRNHANIYSRRLYWTAHMCER